MSDERNTNSKYVGVSRAGRRIVGDMNNIVGKALLRRERQIGLLLRVLIRLALSAVMGEDDECLIDVRMAFATLIIVVGKLIWRVVGSKYAKKGAD